MTYLRQASSPTPKRIPGEPNPTVTGAEIASLCNVIMAGGMPRVRPAAGFGDRRVA